MSDNYLTGRGPTVTCEYCGSVLHAEATDCPDPHCKQSYARFFVEGKDSRDITGADYAQGMHGPFGASGL